MKKQLFLFLALFVGYITYGQELVTGGNMENPSAWNAYFGTNGSDTGTFEFNYTADVPAAGAGGCYRVTGAGQSASFLWQAVTIVPGHNYSLSAAYKFIADTAVNTWIEFFLTRVKPDSGEVNTGMGYSLNTWMASVNINFDGTFQDDFALANTATSAVHIDDTVTQTEWYVVLKAGCWNNAGDTAPVYDVLFDEISVIDGFRLENVVVGEVDNAADFTGYVNLTWDADSVYMIYDIVDDSIVTEGNPWEVDNIEIYFDMDNSKNIHYPRDGGWMANDPTFDTNDYQLRLVPTKDWATNNANFGGAIQKYTETSNGYQFVLNIAWDSLLTGFDGTIDTLIGFDILASDNDVAGSGGAGRNQITWNSPTDKAFNDPSIWGVLQLTPSGSFKAITDAEKPTDPSNVVATVADVDVTLTWDASTDNRVVNNYIVYNGNTAVDTILAKETGNSFEFAGLEAGDYTFGVTAMDIYGNKSAKVTATATIVIIDGVETTTADICKIYPNPSNGVLNIVAADKSQIAVEVYNIAGGLVMSDVFTSTYKLELSQGVYFIHMRSNADTQVTKILVK